jgi:short-subunit dehydrogenase
VQSRWKALAGTSPATVSSKADRCALHGGKSACCRYGLRSNLSNMDIGVLVNNAGMSYEHPEYFHLLDQSIVENMSALNNASLVKMTYTVLPGMVQRGKGAVVNISSGSATFLPAAPFLSLYAASKAFVDTFSVGLASEYRCKGIDVQARPIQLLWFWCRHGPLPH